ITLNCLKEQIIEKLLNPVHVSEDEDIIYTPRKEEKKELFSTIYKRMVVGMNMVIVNLAMVIGDVALTAAVNGINGVFVHGMT
ncbi:NupC/NupG family nucleoside CNT transporter, partial [Bacillus subtilis]